MKIVIIKYNAGNIESVKNALLRLGILAEITGDHEKIKRADKVIFPGVGEASTTMDYLKKEGLDRLIPALKQRGTWNLPGIAAHVQSFGRRRYHLSRYL